MSKESFIDIAILEMGGTINGILNPEDTPPADSKVIAHLKSNATDLRIRISSEIVAMKDSRAVNLADRQRLIDAVQRSSASRILIPHGTFTMPESGEFLMDNLEAKELERSIVLVGAIIPLEEPQSLMPR